MVILKNMTLTLRFRYLVQIHWRDLLLVLHIKMEKEKLIDIATDVKNKSNGDLFLVEKELYDEFEKTKSLIIDLTRHMESISELYNNVNTEIGKRQVK